MANSFSLLLLPNEERFQVLQCMDRRSLLLLSLLSRNTKNLVRSLKLKPIRHYFVVGHMRILLDTSHFLVFFDDITRLIIQSWDVQIAFYREPRANMNLLGKPNKVWVEVKEGTDLNPRYTEIEFPNFLEIKEWYEHILYVVNARPGLEMKIYQRSEQFDLGAIKTVFGKFDSLVFHFREPRDHVRGALNTFLPDLKKLILPWNPYPRGDTRLQKMLIHNFDILDLGSKYLFERLNLDALHTTPSLSSFLFVMGNSFSLLRLPNEERLQVLRCMDRMSLLLLSLLSRNTKDLVRSLQLKPISPSSHSPMGDWQFSFDITHLKVCLTRRLSLLIHSWDICVTFYEEPQNEMEVLKKPNKVWIADGTIFRKLEIVFPNRLEIKEWYEHILYIINAHPERQMIFSNGGEQFDVPTIKTVFGKFDSLAFNFSEPRDYVKKVLDTFLPDLNELYLIRNPYSRGDTRLQKMLVQNVDKFDLGGLNSFEKLNFEDLLICNARYITFSLNQQFDNFNQFLKLWIKGSNRRLQKLTIEQRTSFNQEDILKGIKNYREIPNEENIVYGEDPAWKYAQRTRAVDIERCDESLYHCTSKDLGDLTLSEIL
ncbi:unnamed protein product [Caenorhabditis brenneri]